MAIESFRKQRKSLQAQIDLLELKKSRLEITSPIAGTITTPQLKRRYTDFPTVASFALLEVVDLKGAWQLELKIPQGKMGYIDSAFQDEEGRVLDVEFKIGTNPNLNLKGKLSKASVEPRAVPSETAAPDFRAIVEISPDQIEELQNELRSGAGATAKILCGKVPLGKFCFYQVWDFLQTKVFF